MLSFVLKTAAFTALLFLIVTHSQTTSAEWEDVPAEQKRLESQKTAVPEKTEVIDKSVYKVGEGIIEGAFGIDFDVSLDASITIKDLGWIPMFTLPDGLSYTGLIQPFDLRCLSVKPPSVPALINKANISYKVCLDFSSNPLWIHADNVRDTDRVIEILKRAALDPG